MNSQLFIDKINNALSHMTKSQRSVASYYLLHLNEASLFTLETAAEKMQVSTTTVIRFARALGYTGFTQMQKDLQQNLLSKAGLPERLQELQSSSKENNKLLISSMQNDIDDITKTFDAIDSSQLDKVVNMINDARKVYILGLRSSFSLAHYLTSRLSQIRPDVRLVQTEGMLYPEDFSGANDKDLCITFLFPRYSNTTLKLLQWLKKKKTPVVLVTSTIYDDVAELGNIILPCSVTGVSFKNSFAGPIALINYIAAATAIVGHDRAMETIKDTESFLDMGDYIGV